MPCCGLACHGNRGKPIIYLICLPMAGSSLMFRSRRNAFLVRPPSSSPTSPCHTVYVKPGSFTFILHCCSLHFHPPPPQETSYMYNQLQWCRCPCLGQSQFWWVELVVSPLTKSLFLFHVFECFASMLTVCVPLPFRRQRRPLHALELDFRCCALHMGAGYLGRLQE